MSEWLKGLPMRDALGMPDPDPQAGEGTAELDLYADATHAFASGTFKGNLTVACGRCIGPVKLAKRGMARAFQLVHIFPAMTVFQTIAVAVVTQSGKGLSMFASLEGDGAVAQRVREVA